MRSLLQKSPILQTKFSTFCTIDFAVFYFTASLRQFANENHSRNKNFPLVLPYYNYQLINYFFLKSNGLKVAANIFLEDVEQLQQSLQKHFKQIKNGDKRVMV